MKCHDDSTNLWDNLSSYTANDGKAGRLPGRKQELGTRRVPLRKYAFREELALIDA